MYNGAATWPLAKRRNAYLWIQYCNIYTRRYFLNCQQTEERSTRVTHLSVIVSALLQQTKSNSSFPLEQIHYCESMWKGVKAEHLPSRVNEWARSRGRTHEKFARASPDKRTASVFGGVARSKVHTSRIHLTLICP